MSFLGFETPEENYAKAKARYYAEHGKPERLKPIRQYGDGWYDPNIRYCALQTRGDHPSANRRKQRGSER